MSTERSLTYSSTFNWEESNLKELLKEVKFSIMKRNDESEPFCHYTHKNLKWKEAPFRSQDFMIVLQQMVNVKYIMIDNFTHGSQMTISIGQQEGGEMVEVYKEKYICKGKTLKKELKRIDLGALPCQTIQISVTKGCKISSKNIWLVGVESREIQEKLGTEYFRLLVINPLKIVYTD